MFLIRPTSLIQRSFCRKQPFASTFCLPSSFPQRLFSNSIVNQSENKAQENDKDSQDDFFSKEQEKVVKVEQKDDPRFDYTGRIADRQTEEEYTTENLITYDQKFADKCTVFVYGGDGGSGCCSWQRENHGTKVPDGGSGGDGGSVYFRASSRLSNLYELRRAHFRGNGGKGGKGKKGHGAHGKTVRFTVPLGTEVFEIKKADMEERDKKLQIKFKVADLDQEGNEVLVARGGRGGSGNLSNKQLHVPEPGQKSAELHYELRLKVIADVGFIGWPNAGKSTLLSALTRAFPKIASYPFTTLHPHIGQTKFVDETKIVLADLPGIIEGAHENKGLGHEFLQHAERTKCILYVLDGTIAEKDRSPLKDYKVLYNELLQYKNGILLNKPSIIALNKCDRKYTNYSEREKTLRKHVHAPLIAISAKEGTNLELLLEQIRELVIKADDE